MTQLQINAADYGLEENKAKQISDMFKPMLDAMTSLEGEYNDIVARKPSNETCVEAKALRLRYRDIRTGTAKIHKELKDFYLQGGRFVDGWKNTQLMASQGIEDKLRAIEDHFVNIEKVRIEKLQADRAGKLLKFEVEFIPEQLGEMDQSVWDNYLSGVRLNYQAKKDAEKKAEEERLEKERIEALRSERSLDTAKYADFIPGYNDLDLGMIDEKVYRKMLEDARKDYEAKKKEDERIRKENERLQDESRKRDEREDKRKEAEKKKEERQAKMTEMGLMWNGQEFCYKDINFHWTDLIVMSDEDFQKTVDGATVRMGEIRKEEEEDLRKKREEEEEIQASLNADDEEKTKSLMNDLQQLKSKYTFKSKKNQKMYSDVGLLIDKVIKHIQ